MDYELDIKKTVKLLERNIIVEQQSIETMLNEVHYEMDCVPEIWHIRKIKAQGAVDAMKNERDKLLEMSKGE